MKITVTVTVKLEADQKERNAGDPEISQTYTQVEIHPTAWPGTVYQLAHIAATDVHRMIRGLVEPADQG